MLFDQLALAGCAMGIRTPGRTRRGVDQLAFSEGALAALRTSSPPRTELPNRAKGGPASAPSHSLPRRRGGLGWGDVMRS